MKKYINVGVLACIALATGCGTTQATPAQADEKPSTITGVVDFLYRDGAANSYFTLENSTGEYTCYVNNDNHCTFVQVGDTVTFTLSYSYKGKSVGNFVEQQ